MEKKSVAALKLNATYLVIFDRRLTHGDRMWHGLCSLHNYWTECSALQKIHWHSQIFPPVSVVQIQFLTAVSVSVTGQTQFFSTKFCCPRPARRFVQPVGLHNALSALWWNGNCPISRDLQYGEGGGGITVLISWMVFTPHCLKFLSLKPYQWVGLDMTGLSPRPSLQLSKDDVSIIRSHSMDPVDMYWHWLQIMLIRV